VKKIIIIVLIALAISFVYADSVAFLSTSKGNVSLTRADKQVKFKTGEMLENKDEIRTGAESFAAYKFIDGGANIKVFANSVVEIKASKSGKNLDKSVKVSKGSVLSNVTKGRGNYQVETPTTVASVRGTDFLTQVAPDGSSVIIVTDGIVELVTPTGEVVTVEAGYTAHIDGDGNIEVVETTDEEIKMVDEANQEDTTLESPKKTMRIQVTDDQGSIRYIEIKY
jgi:hypothetical protein